MEQLYLIVRDESENDSCIASLYGRERMNKSMQITSDKKTVLNAIEAVELRRKQIENEEKVTCKDIKVFTFPKFKEVEQAEVSLKISKK